MRADSRRCPSNALSQDVFELVPSQRLTLYCVMYTINKPVEVFDKNTLYIQIYPSIYL